VKHVFKTNMPEHLYVLSQEISEFLKLIYSDVCDSSRVITRGSRRYFLTFINDYSKFCYTYLLKSMDEVFNWFKVYKIETENQLERKIKILRSDHGVSIP